MKRRIMIILLLFTSVYTSANAQTTIAKSESRFASSIDTLITVLENHVTVPIALHSTQEYSLHEGFYDSVISRYFCYNKMIPLFNIDTAHFAVAGKLDILRHSLNTLDIKLDSMAGKKLFLKEEDLGNENEGHFIHMQLYYMEQERPVTVCDFFFIADCLQPVSISSMIRGFK